jgi:ribosomal-protein-alanine N-acetyltransferase
VTSWTTDRLIIRPWTEDDAADMHIIFSDPEAMRFWNVPLSTGPQDLVPRIRHSREAPPEHHAAWAVVLVQTGQAVGFLNYHHREMQNRRLEIGYILARAFWGQGLAREAVSALLGHCFADLRANRVEALIDPDNHASIRLAQRLGFRQESGPMRERLIMPDGRAADILMFGLLAADWQPRSAAGGTC